MKTLYTCRGSGVPDTTGRAAVIPWVGLGVPPGPLFTRERACSEEGLDARYRPT
jgi:hypothetical protein